MRIDLTNELMNEDATASVDDVETAAASSGELPAGKYHVRLEGAQNKSVNDKPLWELTFVLLAGQFAGRKVRYSIWLGVSECDKDGNPKPADKIAADVKRVKDEFWHAAGVLGLAVKTNGADGKAIYKLAPGRRDFRDVLGADCIVDTTVRAYKDKDGNDKRGSEVKMFGIYALSDPKAKDVVKAATGGSGVGNATTTHVGAQTNAAPAQSARDRLKDLV